MIASVVGCASNPRAPTVPVTLTYPYTDYSSGRFPGFREVAQRAKPGYVRLTIYDRSGGEPADVSAQTIVIASGIVVDRQGHVVTAAHIAKSTEFGGRITTSDGRQHEADILHVSPERELALLRIRSPDTLSPVRFANSARLARADPALAIGSPDGKAGITSVGRVRIPKRKRRVSYGIYGFDSGIELDMEVETGHSGGPVFDSDGRAIGMVASYLLGDTTKTPYVSPGIAFAVPSNDIRRYLDERLP